MPPEPPLPRPCERFVQGFVSPSDSYHCVPCPRPRLSHILLRRTWALQPLCPISASMPSLLRTAPVPPPHCVHVPGPRPCIGAVLRRCPWPLPTTSAPLALYERRHPFSAPSHCVLRLRPLCPSPSPTSAPPLCLYVPALSLVLPQSPLPRPKYERRSLFFVFFR
ncbi:hypothetical protein BJV77DRAFT_729886 [Russula vinacea]|nr:hypothetical protein BJV77DRAFT_729886 [Russula vinacea]